MATTGGQENAQARPIENVGASPDFSTGAARMADLPFRSYVVRNTTVADVASVNLTGLAALGCYALELVCRAKNDNAGATFLRARPNGASTNLLGYGYSWEGANAGWTLGDAILARAVTGVADVLWATRTLILVTTGQMRSYLSSYSAAKVGAWASSGHAMVNWNETVTAIDSLLIAFDAGNIRSGSEFTLYGYRP